MPIDTHRLESACQIAREHLLAERTSAGHWVGELSTSALSTATAVMALEQVRRDRQASGGRQPSGASNEELARLISGGIAWLIAHQNDDGGWGDTTRSKSNISTTMLCRATLACASESRVERPEPSADRETREGQAPAEPQLRTAAESTLAAQRELRPFDGGPSFEPSLKQVSLDVAERYIDAAGGIPALIARYGKDRTFSVPILTHCALAGLVDWRTIPALPFELACLPAKFYAAVRLPVVSYALPALIAIGQVRHHFAPTRNPITRFLRTLAASPTLRVLERIQPTNGGFLEATPLTSFVTMSLAGMGRSEHPVAMKGVEFIVNSVRPDGSWPIDTNLATWVTTLAVNALGDDLPEEDRPPIREWLLRQQYREVHPYTNAAPGGWAWTDLPGGVPDADDTPGAMLALMNLDPSRERHGANVRRQALPDGRGSVYNALSAAARWLIDLQNRDGGFPTFCRGWGALPFDRSSPDISAHALRALIATFCKLLPQGTTPTLDILMGEPGAWGGNWITPAAVPGRLGFDIPKAIGRGFRFLRRAQRPDGSWLPLWFGNQHAPDDINPTYGTAKVLAALRDAGLAEDPAAHRGIAWLLANQNDDGGWGGLKGTPSSVEETSLAVEILCDLAPDAPGTATGLEWLIRAVEDGSYLDPSPIGFYFAKLWYFERLYPVIFTVAALRAARRRLNQTQTAVHDGAALPAR